MLINVKLKKNVEKKFVFELDCKYQKLKLKKGNKELFISNKKIKKKKMLQNLKKKISFSNPDDFDSPEENKFSSTKRFSENIEFCPENQIGVHQSHYNAYLPKSQRRVRLVLKENKQPDTEIRSITLKVKFFEEIIPISIKTSQHVSELISIIQNQIDERSRDAQIYYKIQPLDEDKSLQFYQLANNTTVLYII